ncbi:erythrocyte membrane protein 1, PfEMP1, putative [Plasmodium sp. gorilla clade G1]|nr:erythrocyte membrane protein 1, PfEMP1, putative [Plasmodium sp. gorilla clade G1]
MAPQSSGDPQDESAKHALDRIGAEVQDIAHNAALGRSYNELQGHLSQATYANDIVVEGEKLKACDLDHEYHTNVTDGHSDPCGNRPNVRFSDIYEGQCTDTKIKGNKGNTEGACAPFRRLFLCDQNLSHMQENKIKNTHNLLLEVSLAAQHEGESIVKNYEQLGHHTTEGICTALARSFADIGDIIRGKDLFLGYNKSDQKEKEKLQENLKNIFKNIYGGLKDPKKAHYNDPDGNFYQLREDWWNANRLDIWKAITCKAENAYYFRNGCGVGRSQTTGKCQCIDGTVPTNFDYIPQYLRWFDEWTEEFCRIKELKLENIKTRCRGEKDGEKYCSRNGCDCEQTINRIGHLRYGNGCTRCLFGCNRYMDWINKKKEEFEKQKEKYGNEKNTNNKGQKTTSSDINNIYYEKFYEKLNKKYTNVNGFLKSLNEETKCKNIDEEDKESKIDFNNNKTTFSGSQYCKPCPPCGVKKNKDGNFINRGEEEAECQYEKTYTPSGRVKPTDIDVLSFGEEPDEIKRKYDKFCGSPENIDIELIEQWKCYYEKDDKEACILEKKENKKSQEKQKPFEHFFDFWVAHMLNDSIYWRKKLNNCIKNGKATKCKIRCKNPCNCFEKWLKKKKKEWDKIKDHYNMQNGLIKNYHFSFLEKFLEVKFLPLIEEAYDDHEEITRIEEMLYKKSMQSDDTLEDKNDIIDILLDHEKEDAKTCTQTHKPPCPLQPDDEDHEELPPSVKYNPCARVQPTKTMKEIARDMQRFAQKQLRTDGSKDDLTADASKGTYRKGGKADELNNICNIKVGHSNTTRNYSKEPCTGKDTNETMFALEEGWKTGEKIEMSDKYAYMPPRRQHFCTSNLEYLEKGDKPLDDTGEGDNNIVNNSFLGDVLLAANHEADFIRRKYKGQSGYDDKETMCRAMKYSFADLGDIIKGTDLWDLNGGEKTTQENLVKIFKNIKEELPEGIKDNKKYKDKDKHLELRKDWWEANRKQIWQAMKCPTTNGSNGCNDKDPTPVDDYIPQRLRWMNEWAEWYCKMQSQEYNKLVTRCQKCMEKGSKQCTQKDGDCRPCKEACDAYGKKIRTWKEQWTKMEQKYNLLYLEAKNAASNGGPDTSTAIKDENDKHVVKFLFELYKQNGGKIGNPSDNIRARHKRSTRRDTTHVYSTAAGYIHQEMGPNVGGCVSQTEFCDNKNGKYTFENPPPLYKDACNCENNKQKPAPKKQDLCDTLKTLLDISKGGTEGINGCNPKNTPKSWECNRGNLVSGNGECMPPRRQTLCISNLLQNISTENDLKDAFIKCAAKEIHFFWKKYEDDKQKENPTYDTRAELKQGKIPEDFKRQMFYTFGDYRDLCLGTDISAFHYPISNVKNNINNYFNKNKGKEKNDNTERVTWWNKNKGDIWEAMVCGLSHYISDNSLRQKLTATYTYSTVTFSGDKSPTLEKFAQTPQFLRWMTEWGEEFCKKQQKHYMNLVEGCKECTLTDDGTVSNDVCRTKCAKCKEECLKYSAFITQWKGKWSKQSEKYENVYNKVTKSYNTSDSDETEKKLLQYLKELKDTSDSSDKYSTSGKYINEKGYISDCIEQKDFSNDGNEYAFKDYPYHHETKCECRVAQEPEPPEPAEEEYKEEACEIVKKIFDDKDEGDKYFEEACKLKYNGRKEIHTQWKCTTNKSKYGVKDDDVVCIPPRTQKLYVHNLKTLTENTSQNQLRKAFIECAAVETFFAWHKYKKDIENEKIRKKKEEQYVGFTLPYGEEEEPSLDNDPQKDLDEGNIPEEFKRQMFYAFGDYQDICLGKYIGIDVTQFNQKITDVFQKSDQTTTGKKITPDKWWDENAEDIWEGMLCALCYDTNNKKVIEGVHEKLIGDTKNPIYNYNSVTISSGISLSNFAKRPTFFRWLEEWGEEFCRKKKFKIEKLINECRGVNSSGNKIYCSCDGYDCTRSDIDRNEVFVDLDCPRCGEECTNYKKWIKNKKNEFDNQKIKYDKEIEKSNISYKNDQNFYNYLKNDYPSINSFLESSNHGNHCQGNSDKRKNTFFKDVHQTFGPSEYCKACPVYGVNCNNRKQKCENIDENEYKRKKVSGKNENDTNPTIIDVLVSGRKGKYNDKYDDNLCKMTDLFEDVTVQNWKCRYLNKTDQCNLTNFSHNIDVDEDIAFNDLFQRWLRYFVQDYNKLKDKINPCIKMEVRKENTCIEGCEKICECVKKWLKIKEDEWKNIKSHFYKYSKTDDDTIPYRIKSYFQRLYFDTNYKKSQDVVEGENEKEKLWGCTGSNDCNEEDKIKYDDFITKLISELRKKIDTHDTQRKEPQTQCDPYPLTDEPYDESPEDDETSTTSVVPEICKDIVTPTAPEKQAPLPGPEVIPEQDSDTAGTEEEEERPDPPKKPEIPSQKPKERKKQKRQLPTHTSILPEMVSISAFPLSVGIAFAALSYFLLKKKTKSTIDLLRVIDIPKGDYGIPTMKSKNRYIPYASDRRKGKTYIYMEGDSSDDYTFMSDTTDVTSSESEFEERDINDIYVPGSPKYKTLIEVVLEPSKRDTMKTQSDIPLNDKLDSDKLTDEEWNKLKQDFISILQNPQNDLPKNNISGNIQMDTHPHVNILDDSMEEKLFITSIHDRDLHNGEEVTYNINLNDQKNMNFSTNDDNKPSKNDQNDLYTGIDLINDSISGNHNVDIYDELLKRKENELFGTNHTKHTTTNSVAKQTHTDPILNQINLFHKWLDRHRNTCEQWDKNKKEELLDKLKEEWEQYYNNNSGDIHTSDNNIVNTVNHVFNTDVSIQIDMNDPKPINQFTNMYTNSDNSTMDNILNDLEKHRKPYFYDVNEDDITYFDIDDEETPIGDIYVDHNNVNSNNMDVPNKVHIEMNIVNNKKEIFEEGYPISDIWNI